ncbi:MAG TPA: CBS domain-containing protein [Candidatus Binatia bacterium]|nr:CBS domain-containing protein [Candidatus Binatia bacterium]
MQVREVMTANVERVPPETSLSEAATKMKQCDVGAIPVYDGDRLIGMLTDRDIAIRAVAEAKDSAATPVCDVMSRGIAYCFDDQDIREAGALMRQEKLRRLIVLNRDKRLVGIVSLGDLAAQGDDKVAGKTLKGVARDGRQRPASTPTKRARAAQTR